MISDEKIWNIADEYRGYGGEIDVEQFARAVYEQGRADQRESDASLAGMYMLNQYGASYGVESVIRANTED